LEEILLKSKEFKDIGKNKGNFASYFALLDKDKDGLISF